MAEFIPHWLSGRRPARATSPTLAVQHLHPLLPSQGMPHLRWQLDLLDNDEQQLPAALSSKLDLLLALREETDAAEHITLGGPTPPAGDAQAVKPEGMPWASTIPNDAEHPDPVGAGVADEDVRFVRIRSCRHPDLSVGLWYGAFRHAGEGILCSAAATRLTLTSPRDYVLHGSAMQGCTTSVTDRCYCNQPSLWRANRL